MSSERRWPSSRRRWKICACAPLCPRRARASIVCSERPPAPVQLTDNCLADARLSSRDLHADRQNAELLPVIYIAATVVDLSLNHYLHVICEGQTVGPQSPSPVLFIDSGLLCIAIANLLDNSVKYSASGEIRIEIYRLQKGFEIRIGDRGPGIAPEQVEHIFERYRRGETHTTTPAGTGLGLYVARQIIQAHGGELCLGEKYR